MNKLLLWLLHTPLRPLAGRHTIAITYVGPRSGREFTLPVWAIDAPDGRGWLVGVGQHEQKRWWRSFRTPQPARLLVKGREYAATGHLLTGADRDAAAAAYVKAIPMAARAIRPDTPALRFDRVD